MRIRTASRRAFQALILFAALAASARTVMAGQGVWRTGGPWGGSVGDLAIDPKSPSTLYAATYGGLFKSTDGGATWAPSGAGLPNGSVGRLAIDPLQPSRLHVAIWGAGVYRSADGGKSWAATNTGLTSRNVADLAIDPLDPSILYAGTSDGGIFTSSDGGDSWSAASSGLPEINIERIALCAAVPSTLYAATAGGFVYRSTDAGGSWALASNGLRDGWLSSLAVDPSNPSALYVWKGNFLFRSTDGGKSWVADSGLGVPVRSLAVSPAEPSVVFAGTTAGLYKSADSGKSWRPVSSGTLASAISVIAFDPANPATLYAGAAGLGVAKSTDAGESWTLVNVGLAARSVSAIALIPAVPSVVFAGTVDGRVYVSADSGLSWSLSLASADPGYDLIDALAIDPSSPSTVYAAASDGYGDGSRVFRSSDSGLTWVVRGTNDSSDFTSLAVDPSNGETLYAATDAAGVWKSTDGGATWASAGTGFGDGWFAVPAVAVDPAATATVYAGTSDRGVFKSTDAGVTWAAINDGLPEKNVLALAVDPKTPSTLYAGTMGGVFRSTDGGASWTADSNGLANLHVRALEVDARLSSTLYAGTDGGVFRSGDAGRTWASVSTGLPPGPVRSLVLDPTGPGTLYAGLSNGGVWQATAPAASVTALLPAAARASGSHGAFYTTDLSVSNTGPSPAYFTLKFLGHDRDGSDGPESSFSLSPGATLSLRDVLGSAFGLDSAFGALRVSSNSSDLDVVSVTSTPGFGGTFGQTVPAVPVGELVSSGSARSIPYVREGDGFRSNLVLSSNSNVETTVDAALVAPDGSLLAARSYSIPPSGMTQVGRVAWEMGVAQPVTGARLVLSSPTDGAAFTAFLSVIDETTNDSTTIPLASAPPSGPGPFVWLLPAAARSHSASGAFFSTNLALSNSGPLPLSFSLRFLGHGRDGSAGPERSFLLEAGRSVTYFDLLGSVFGLDSGFGAVRITSDSPDLGVASVTSTPGFGGTLSQTVPAVHASDLIPAGTPRSILHIREDDAFRSNLVLASNANAPTSVDVTLVSEAGETLATKSYVVPPNGMIQIQHVARDMGVPGALSGARLVLSSDTTGAAFSAFVSLIDNVTNDPTTLVAR
jgi:photosystem II stability/assembly factor-like uncharacterized protein